MKSIKNLFCTKDKEKEKSSTDDGFQRFSWKALRSKKVLCAIQGRFKEVAEKKKYKGQSFHLLVMRFEHINVCPSTLVVFVFLQF